MDATLVSKQCEGKWKGILVGNAKYFICATESANKSYKVSMTNLIDIWTEELDSEKILQKCEKLNPNLSIEDIDVYQFIREIFEDIPKHAAKVSVEQIILSSELEGGIFEFTIDLTKGSAQQFWEEVTMPLCLAAGELSRRQKILMNLVKKKDAEILEYRLNEAKLIREDIRTDPFHEDLFKKNIPTQNAESCQDVFEQLIELREDVKMEISVKTEPAKNCFPENLAQAVTISAANDEAKSKTGKRFRHTLLSVDGPARQKRRRCVECYRKQRQSGLSAADAASLTKQVKTYCDNCSEKPHLCLPCFNSTHENICTEALNNRETLVKIEVEENPEENNIDESVVNTASSNIENELKSESVIQESDVLEPKAEKSSTPELPKPSKSVTERNHCKVDIPKRTRSAATLPAKRTRKNIHDFIK